MVWLDCRFVSVLADAAEQGILDESGTLYETVHDREEIRLLMAFKWSEKHLIGLGKLRIPP